MVSLKLVKNEGVALQINNQAKEMPNTARAISFWIEDYLLPKEGEGVAEATRDLLRAEPNLIETYISRAQTEHESALIAEVEKNYKEVLKNTDEEYVAFVAEQFILNKKLKKLANAVNSRQGIRKAFTEFYATSKLWEEIVALASDEAVKMAATAQVSRTRSKELTDKLGIDDEFDMETGASYAARKVDDLKRGERNSFYKSAGLAYTKMKVKGTDNATYFTEAA